MQRSIRWLGVSAIALAASVSARPVEGTSETVTNSASPVRRPAAAASRLPLLFVENGGQTDARVALYAKTPSGTAYLTERGVTWGLVAGGRRWALVFDFVGAREGARPEGEDASPTTVSYLRGPRANWHAGLAAWKKARSRDLWPGIDCVHETDRAGLKYSFEIGPGADPSDIRIDVRGAEDLRVDAAGRLVATTPVATYVDDRPVAWQDTPAGRRDVAVAFDLRDRRLGFRVGAHDPLLPLVIDPPTQVYASAFGGAGADFAGGIATDADGNAYVTGRTVSDETTFPVTAGLDPTFNGGDFSGFDDAFVAKINPAGDAFVYLTYLGGTKRDWGADIAVDGAGAAYVCGLTASSADFPTAVGPDLTHGGGFDDGFIVKLNPAGTALVWGGFIGGVTDPFGLDETASGIALDATGRAHVVGTTAAQTGFPTAGGFDATPNGGSDIFVVVVAADGTGFERAGFLGGAGSDTGNDIALGPAGSIYVCGKTTAASFPATVGPDLTYGGGTEDGVCAKFDATGALQWAGFWGGAAVDVAMSVDVDDDGNAYLAGYTNSREDNGFPVVNAYDATANGMFDACVARVRSDGTAFETSTFLGGAGSDIAVGIDVSPPRAAAKRGGRKSASGPPQLVLIGTTASGMFPFTGTGMALGGEDAFLVVDPHGYLAGGGVDLPNGIRVGTPSDDRFEAVTYDASLGSAFVVGDSFDIDLGPFARIGTAGVPADVLFAKYDVAPGVQAAPLLFAPRSAVFGTDRRGRHSLVVEATLDIGPDGVAADEPVTLSVARGWGTPSELTLLSDDPGSSAPRFSSQLGAEFDASVIFALPKSAHGSGRYDLYIDLGGDLDGVARPGDVVTVGLQQSWRASFKLELLAACPAPPKGPCNPLKIPGAPVDPAVAPTSLKGTIDALGNGKLLGKFKLGDVGDVKTTAPDLTITIGDGTTITLSGAEAKKYQESWVYRGPISMSGAGGGGGSATVLLKASNKTMTIDAKGVTFGNLPEGKTPVEVKVKVGAAEDRFRLNMKRLGKKIYW